MATKTSNSGRTLFKKYSEEYIKTIDKFGIVSIFDKLGNHNLDEMLGCCDLDENRPFINKAKERLFSFAREKNTYNIEHFSKFLFEEYDELIKKTEFKERIYYLLIIAFLLIVYDERIKEEILAINEYEQIRKESNEKVYFRGQCLSQWRMWPSVFRELKGNIVFDDGYYNALLKNYKLDMKFNDIMRKGVKQNAYQKYAFIQHACSYSPLIDFTRSEQIATSFALSNTSSFNLFNENDSAIYELTLLNRNNVYLKKQDARDFLKYTMMLDIIEKPVCIGKTYTLKTSSGGSKTITISSLPVLVKLMTPKYKIIDIPTNDRMVYQQGAFVCFYDCLCINGYILYELINDINIVKKIIPAHSKKKIIKSIYDERQYDQEHLLNPYLYFNE